MSAGREALLAAERRRRDLLVAADFGGLERLLHADLSYVHLNGLRQNQAEYLEHVARDFRMIDMRWENCRVRVHGALGLLDGTIVNSLVPSSEPDGPTRDFRAIALLVWVLEDCTWRLMAYQGTRPVT
jgi:hypothetical protein